MPNRKMKVYEVMYEKSEYNGPGENKYCYVWADSESNATENFKYPRWANYEGYITPNEAYELGDYTHEEAVRIKLNLDSSMPFL